MEERPASISELSHLSEVQRDAWGNLFDSYQRVVDRIDHNLRSEYGLSISEWDALVHLWDGGDGGMTMGELSNTVKLSASGMTRLVTRLEDRGLVERRRGETDGRQKRVAVTSKGSELIAETCELHDRVLKEYFFSALTENSCKQLARILGTVLGHIESREDD